MSKIWDIYAKTWIAWLTKLNLSSPADEIPPYSIKDQKMIFCQWSHSLWKRNLKYPNNCFKLSWAQIFAWTVFQYRFNSSQHFAYKFTPSFSRAQWWWCFIALCEVLCFFVNWSHKHMYRKWNCVLKSLNCKKMGVVEVFKLKFLIAPFTLG